MVDKAAIKPLQGLRVLDFTAMPPGGYCTVQLADLGADVVRIEAPSLSGQKSLVVGEVGLSRGKRSMTLDLRKPEANQVLLRLAQATDIVVENAQPGSMTKRGFGYPQASAENPGLIWCSITGFGQDGPYATRAGHDLSYLGHSGLLCALSPELPWHPGAMLSVPLGAMQATTAILAALIERQRTGKGCQIDISLAEASSWLLSGMSYAMKSDFGGIPVTHDRRLYACADGRFITVAAAEPRTWTALCTGLGIPELSDKLRATGHEARAITERLTAIFATRPAAEWVALMGPVGAAVNVVNRGEEVVHDPQTVARHAVLTVAGQAVPANPIRLSDAQGRQSTTATGEPPLVGQHSNSLLSEMGYSDREIAALRTTGVV